jgi:hypothetical protein
MKLTKSAPARIDATLAAYSGVMRRRFSCGGKVDKAGFLTRYYEWANTEWTREIAEGLTRISTLPCRSLRTGAAVLARRTKEDQYRVAKALTKRFHPEACQLLGCPATADEEALFQLILRERFNEGNRVRLRAGGGAKPKIDTKGLRKRLRTELTTFTGSRPDPEFEIGVEWRHVQYVAGVRVLTYIDTGGRSRQAEYHQDLYREDGSEIKRFISLGSWLGLGQSGFNCIVPGGEEEAVGQIIALCQHFLEAVPKLTSDG